MSLVFGNGARTVTTGTGGRPYDFGRPFSQQQQGGMAGGQQQGNNGTRPAPGWASPAQPREQSFGTPYGGSGGFDAYRPQQSAGPNGGAMTPQGERWYSQAPSQQVSGDPRGGYASTPGNRPPPFQMAPAQTPWGQSMDPFADRDAFVGQINNQRAQRQLDFNNSGSVPPPTWGGQPVLNQQQAMMDAGLGAGSPSMSPEYGDSLIFRLNQQFGGGYPQQPQQDRPMVPGSWAGRKGSDRYASAFEPGSEEWHQEMSRRGQAAQAAERPVATPSRPSPSAPRQPAMPLNPRAASDAARAGGGSRQDASEAWRSAYRASVASPSNRRWLNSLSPDNRRIYQMMQAY